MKEPKITPGQQAILLGLQQGWRISDIAAACSISKATVYRRLADAGTALGVLPQPVVIRSASGGQTKRHAKLTIPKATLIVSRARDAALIDPNVRLTPSGTIGLTPAAAARGAKL